MAMVPLKGYDVGNKKPRCSGTTWDAFGDFRHFGCSYGARVERDGKWYCGVHDPVAVATRKKACEEQHAALVREDRKQGEDAYMESVADDRRLELFPQAIEALRLLSDDHKHGATGEVRQEHLAKARAVLAKAESIALLSRGSS